MEPIESTPAITPVLLSGGSGTRLWPLSRALYPKQFLALAGDGTLFQAALQRVGDLAKGQAPLVVCNEEHRFLAAEQLREVGQEGATLLLEPEGKSTAPAAALAALEAAEVDPEALLLVLPADHVIEDPEAFRHAVLGGVPTAQEGGLVTFGIEPRSPETGFGYIRARSRVASGEVAAVAEFVEKPDADRAQAFLESGDYFWNSGMFLFRADAYLAELERHAPAVLEACRRAMAGSRRDMDFIRPDAAAFTDSPADSIDYAVMEATDRAYVVPIRTGWSDVGSWSALQEVEPADEDGNVIVGDVLSQGNQNCYLRAESRLLAVAGLSNQVVVETGDAVLVAHRDQAQEVKQFVERLKAQERPEYVCHRQVYRPWGTYEQIAQAERFQVKHIFIKPGQQLSLQLHYHRAEHWVVVRGTARVTRDDDSFLLSEDQSTYIPVGCRHRIMNPGSIPLELIEVQTGSYLGEDDIVRFEDRYGRTDN
jgi:mannose-1-phosphate guanylyltransferase/mannose-6-phosphate isomerase